MTIPSATTLEGKTVPWLNFDGLVVGRNSDFRTDTLTTEQIEQIGGTEYRALKMLSWMVPVVGFTCPYIRLREAHQLVVQYFIGVQLISFLIFAPWLLATNKYDAAFQSQYRLVSKAWYVLVKSPVQKSYVFWLGFPCS
jgi:hypothetical protein